MPETPLERVEAMVEAIGPAPKSSLGTEVSLTTLCTKLEGHYPDHDEDAELHLWSLLLLGSSTPLL